MSEEMENNQSTDMITPRVICGPIKTRPRWFWRAVIRVFITVTIIIPLAYFVLWIWWLSIKVLVWLFGPLT
jgi:hypothetical protein